MVLKYYISEAVYRSPIDFFINLLKERVFDHLQEVDEKEHSNIFWDDTDERSEPIAKTFYHRLKTGKDLEWQKVIGDKCLIEDETGRVDPVATVFYMANCLQEFRLDSGNTDKFGRFRYDSSYQNAHQNIDQNLVGKLLTDFALQKGLKPRVKPTKVFISHDVDTIRGGLLQDGYWALRNFKIKSAFSIILQELFSRPSWDNIDRIMKIQTEYDLKSTFFWLMEKGKDEVGIPQADYTPTEVLGHQHEISKLKNFDSGLHKSTFDSTFSQELQKAPEEWTMNRYHFLKFNPYPDWENISSSAIQLDASLGFSEHFGFRNSFGDAFVPFDIQSDKYFDFVEVPLTLMDMTFKNYLKLPIEKTAPTIIDFIEKHSQNCVISLLWHNTFYTNFKFGDYLRVYKEIAKYIVEKRFTTVTGSELLKEYGRD